MMKEKAWYKRSFSCGPGGMKCRCCGPAPGQEKKRELKRQRQTNVNLLTKELESEYLLDLAFQKEANVE